mmetsp:Transcript_10667/g.31742  ORF Transcript_10667/g.31742 Transcript_10667/m.31742 type:complete len:250 (+) Transcript_10667:555-1304(+)
MLRGRQENWRNKCAQPRRKSVTRGRSCPGWSPLAPSSTRLWLPSRRSRPGSGRQRSAPARRSRGSRDKSVQGAMQWTASKRNKPTCNVAESSSKGISPPRAQRWRSSGARRPSSRAPGQTSTDKSRSSRRAGPPSTPRLEDIPPRRRFPPRLPAPAMTGVSPGRRWRRRRRGPRGPRALRCACPRRLATPHRIRPPQTAAPRGAFLARARRRATPPPPPRTTRSVTGATVSGRRRSAPRRESAPLPRAA